RPQIFFHYGEHSVTLLTTASPSAPSVDLPWWIPVAKVPSVSSISRTRRILQCQYISYKLFWVFWTHDIDPFFSCSYEHCVFKIRSLNVHVAIILRMVYAKIPPNAIGPKYS